jgi:hypothetical protein
VYVDGCGGVRADSYHSGNTSPPAFTLRMFTMFEANSLLWLTSARVIGRSMFARRKTVDKTPYFCTGQVSRRRGLSFRTLIFFSDLTFPLLSNRHLEIALASVSPWSVAKNVECNSPYRFPSRLVCLLRHTRNEASFVYCPTIAAF